MKWETPMAQTAVPLSRLWLFLAILQAASLGVAQEQPGVQSEADVGKTGAGRLIRVSLPLSEATNSDARVKRAIGRALAELPKGDQRPTLVLEFTAEKGQFGEGTDFGRALELARYLSSRELANVKTVAFVPRTIKGHGVLPIMACEEMVMAPDAELGEAGIDEDAAAGVDPTVLAGYKQIADRRLTIPPPVALGMIDKEVEVLKVETEVAPEFVLRRDLDAFKKDHAVQSETIIKRPGELGRFSGREGRELGFVKYLAADRDALAKALSLPKTALEADPSDGGEWRSLLVRIRGPISGVLVTHVQREIDEAVRDGGANFICVMIDSPGGSPEDSLTLANLLADLKPSEVRTVAFITREARGDAALIAFACDQIVMSEQALIGGMGAADLDKKEDLELLTTSLRDNLAPKKSRGWSLLAAMLDADQRVYRYTRVSDGRVEYYSKEEAKALPDAGEWKQGDELTNGRGPLKLRGEKAFEIGLARHLAGDFRAFKELYGLERDPKLVEPGWADYLIGKLASPAVGWLFLLIGMAALYAEIQAPGIGLGGFIGGVCFLLFFWNRFFEGTAGWLEVFLFLGGVCCVLIEVFVLPGVAIFGLGGGLMILFSLILASQTFVFPHNEYQWDQLQGSLLSLLAVFAGLIAAVALMRRYLPHTPWAGGVLLEPPSGEELQSISERESLANFRHLLGKQGVATTPLIPTGKARFEGQLVDVTVEGEVVERGKEVIVTAVQGNRVVVKSMS
jgi:membrane-bound ClpP family serine protease